MDETEDEHVDDGRVWLIRDLRPVHEDIGDRPAQGRGGLRRPTDTQQCLWRSDQPEFGLQLLVGLANLDHLSQWARPEAVVGELEPHMLERLTGAQPAAGLIVV